MEHSKNLFCCPDPSFAFVRKNLLKNLAKLNFLKQRQILKIKITNMKNFMQHRV